MSEVKEAALAIRSAVDAMESVDWQHVDGMSSCEAATMTQRLIEAAEETEG